MPDSSIPPLFKAALEVRDKVFVQEQQCPAENEIDEDDAKSWHWVCFDTAEAAAAQIGRGTTGKPVGTLRLIPAAPAELEGKEMDREHLVKSEEDEREEGEGLRTEPRHGKTGMWDGLESFVKVGRMATLKEYRGQGLAKLLLEETMSWARKNAHQINVHGEESSWRGLILSHAQKEVEGWWKKMGFTTDDGLGEWWEEHILHVGMWKRVALE
ncbi:MAG: hypothetical protein LQ342_005031 [Letrouitia transgressa]|nr:MAG: hypothetical protein LQ342_005031 [Letrouitia transgressa]